MMEGNERMFSSDRLAAAGLARLLRVCGALLLAIAAAVAIVGVSAAQRGFPGKAGKSSLWRGHTRTTTTSTSVRSTTPSATVSRASKRTSGS